MSKKIRVGLVLSSVPGYSETFFTTKINVLSKNGFTLFLFANGKRNAQLDCQLIKPYPVFHSSVTRFLSVLLLIPIIFIRSPRAAMRLWKVEKDSGLRTSDAIRSIYINGHILSRQLDWLHFGFATAVIGRENVAEAINAKMAVSFRGFDINIYPIKHPGCYTKLWQRLDQVHSISDYLLQKAFTLGLPSTMPYRIITPAVGLNTKVKTNYEISSPIQILTVARLNWIKGLDYGLAAIAKLKEVGLNIHYTIIGEGPEYERLLIEIDSLRLNGDVDLLGELSHEETLERIRNCDVYIQPSLNEGFCNAVLEAQSMGCLCIASKVGALPENIIPNETGWLVPARDPKGLADGIIQVTKMPISERKRIADNARNHARAGFSIDVHLKLWSLFYQNDLK